MSDRKILVLHEEDNAKVLQISGNFQPRYGSLEQVIATFSTRVELFRFKSGCDDEGLPIRNEQFDLSTEEADSFVEAWTGFKAEQKAKTLAEQQRLHACVAEAYTLAKEHNIKIEQKHQDSDTYQHWTLSMTEPHFANSAYDSDGLLNRVKQALAALEEHKAEQAIVKEAHELAKASGGIIHVRKDGYHWHVTVANPDLFGEWAQDAEQLLTRVKEAQAKYAEWQKEQVPFIPLPPEVKAQEVHVEGALDTMSLTEWQNTARECTAEAFNAWQNSLEQRAMEGVNLIETND